MGLGGRATDPGCVPRWLARCIGRASARNTTVTVNGQKSVCGQQVERDGPVRRRGTGQAGDGPLFFAANHLDGSWLWPWPLLLRFGSWLWPLALAPAASLWQLAKPLLLRFGSWKKINFAEGAAGARGQIKLNWAPGVRIARRRHGYILWAV